MQALGLDFEVPLYRVKQRRQADNKKWRTWTSEVPNKIGYRIREYYYCPHVSNGFLFALFVLFAAAFSDVVTGRISDRERDEIVRKVVIISQDLVPETGANFKWRCWVLQCSKHCSYSILNWFM